MYDKVYNAKKFIKYVKKFGFLPGATCFFKLAYLKGTIELSLPNIKYPIIVREKTTDVYILEEIFLDECYDLMTKIKPKLIIDGGAYVGYSPIYFANKYPGTNIIAVEPAFSNFKFLRENTHHYQEIELIHAGIWHKKAWLRIKNPGGEEWGFEVEEIEEMEPGSIKGITIEEILKKSGYKEIDLLKLNIEGAEKEIFSNNYEKWLDKVNILIIEFHDRIKPGCREAFFSAIKNYNFSQEKSGVYNIFKN